MKFQASHSGARTIAIHMAGFLKSQRCQNHCHTYGGLSQVTAVSEPLSYIWRAFSSHSGVRAIAIHMAGFLKSQRCPSHCHTYGGLSQVSASHSGVRAIAIHMAGFLKSVQVTAVSEPLPYIWRPFSSQCKSRRCQSHCHTLPGHRANQPQH